MGRWWFILLGLTGLAVANCLGAGSSPLGADEKGTISEGARTTATDSYGDLLPRGSVGRLGTARLRDGGQILWAAWSRDGKSLACCTDEGNVRVWDAGTGKERRTLAQGQRGAQCVAFSRSGDTVAGIGIGRVYWWDVETGEEARVDPPEVWTRDGWSLAYSHDGRKLATGWENGLVLIWDAAEHKVVQKLEGTKYQVMALAFSPDDKLLAVGDGFRLPGRSNCSIRLWNLGESKVIAVLEGHDRSIQSVAFSPDGARLASGSVDSTIRLWDTAGGKELRRIKGDGDSVAFSPDGGTLYSGDTLGVVHRWNPADGDELGQFDVGLSVDCLAVSPDGKMLATAAGDNRIGLWKLPSGEEASARVAHTAAVLSVVFSPSGNSLASRAEDGTVRIWDPKSGRQIRRLVTGGAQVEHAQGGRFQSIAFTPDGRALASLGTYQRTGNNQAVWTWDVDTGRLTSELRAGGSSLALSPDGQTLATTAGDGIELWSLSAGKQLRVLDFHEPGAKRGARDLCAVFSPDGRLLASGCSDWKIRFWDWRTGNQVGQIDHPVSPTYIAFSPDGKILASCCHEPGLKPTPAIRLWEVATATLIRQFDSPGGAMIASVAFSPDGRLVASAGIPDKAVRLWDIFTGKEVVKLEGHRGSVFSVAFSPDGQTLASGSADTTVLLWDVRQFKPAPVATNLSDADLAHVWQDLDDAKAAPAYEALWKLAGGGDGAARFLGAHIQVIAEPDAKRVQELIKKLDDEDFGVREGASRELAKLGEAAEPALRRALADKPSEEARRRLTTILDQLKAPSGDAEALRRGRAVQVLEQMGTPQAKEVLEGLARGLPTAGLTRDAKAALERLNRK